MARVTLTDDAKRDIRVLDRSVQARVLKELKKLETSPADRGQPLGSHRSGNLTGLRKLYVGPRKGYRAVFAAEGDTLAVVIVIAARADAECYELALARLEQLATAGTPTEVSKLLLSIMGTGADTVER